MYSAVVTADKTEKDPPLSTYKIFNILTSAGTIQYQAFKTTFMACDASHLKHQIYVNLGFHHLQIVHDPAEFIDEEHLL